MRRIYFYFFLGAAPEIVISTEAAHALCEQRSGETPHFVFVIAINPSLCDNLTPCTEPGYRTS